MATRPTSPTAADGSFRHRLTALVAVYAILAQILLGAIAAAFGPSAAASQGNSPLAQLAALCTPDGLVRITYRNSDDADSAPERVAPKCPFCFGSGHASALPPSGAWTPVALAETARVEWRPASLPAVAALHITELRPRAPPIA